MVSLGNTEIIPINKIKELYHLFIYYYSIGHDIDTIVSETRNKIKDLFFYDGNEFYVYDLPPNELVGISGNSSKVTITGNICKVRLTFTATSEITKDVVIFNFVPVPTFEFRDIINTSAGNKIFRINEDGIMLASDTLKPNTIISGSITFIIDR